MNRITIGEKSSNSQPNTFGTAASATSEICCSAALKACEKLNKRIKTYKKNLLSKSNEISKGKIDEYDIFRKAIKAANQDRVCLRFVSISLTITTFFSCLRFASFFSHIIVIWHYH